MLEYWDFFGFIFLIEGIFVATIAPEMLCGDRRENVLSLYFSRAITRFDYLLAKLVAAAILTLTISLVPCILYWLGRQFLDDSPMSAIKDNYTVEFAVLQGIEAGLDLILSSYDDMSVHICMYETLLKAYRDGKLSEERLNASVRRILTLKANHAWFAASRSGSIEIVDRGRHLDGQHGWLACTIVHKADAALSTGCCALACQVVVELGGPAPDGRRIRRRTVGGAGSIGVHQLHPFTGRAITDACNVVQRNRRL